MTKKKPAKKACKCKKQHTNRHDDYGIGELPKMAVTGIGALMTFKVGTSMLGMIPDNK